LGGAKPADLVGDAGEDLVGAAWVGLQELSEGVLWLGVRERPAEDLAVSDDVVVGERGRKRELGQCCAELGGCGLG
jgi:hypothetical protein